MAADQALPQIRQGGDGGQLRRIGLVAVVAQFPAVELRQALPLFQPHSRHGWYYSAW